MKGRRTASKAPSTHGIGQVLSRRLVPVDPLREDPAREKLLPEDPLPEGLLREEPLREGPLRDFVRTKAIAFVRTRTCRPPSPSLPTSGGPGAVLGGWLRYQHQRTPPV